MLCADRGVHSRILSTPKYIDNSGDRPFLFLTHLYKFSLNTLAYILTSTHTPTSTYILTKMASTSFYQATVPTFKGIANSAVSFLTAAKEEQSKNSSLPSGQELLNAQLGDMLPLRMQPILVSKFPLDGLTTLKIAGSAPLPNLDPSSFQSIDDVINFFKQFAAVFDAVDEKTYNESAEKSLDVTVAGKTMTMTSLAEYYNSFAIPNS